MNNMDKFFKVGMLIIGALTVIVLFKISNNDVGRFVSTGDGPGILDTKTGAFYYYNPLHNKYYDNIQDYSKSRGKELPNNEDASLAELGFDLPKR